MIWLAMLAGALGLLGWSYAWYTRRLRVAKAVGAAIRDVGLSSDYLASTANLLHSGKLDGVLVNAADRLGISCRTTGDLVDLLASHRNA